MRKIINGMSYNTETALEICDVSGRRGTLSCTDFGWENTSLYRTARGRYFIAGCGGAYSRWSVPVGNNGWGGSNGMRPIDESEARDLVERHSTPEVYEATFGAVEAA